MASAAIGRAGQSPRELRRCSGCRCVAADIGGRANGLRAGQRPGDRRATRRGRFDGRGGPACHGVSGVPRTRTAVSESGGSARSRKRCSIRSPGTRQGQPDRGRPPGTQPSSMCGFLLAGAGTRRQPLTASAVPVGAHRDRAHQPHASDRNPCVTRCCRVWVQGVGCGRCCQPKRISLPFAWPFVHGGLRTQCFRPSPETVHMAKRGPEPGHGRRGPHGHTGMVPFRRAAAAAR